MQHQIPNREVEIVSQVFSQWLTKCDLLGCESPKRLPSTEVLHHLLLFLK